ncbi:uncharacterized protein LOC129294670 [Prosopis cineraria]|uniref:uncharacterized protein LOC129294670 n=1 Tax=Prosopis cineraria TaxID=364024 RepID=UPI00240F65B1|nr:uncharacterized protein LOC129294670 [Prosopis cineraria]
MENQGTWCWSSESLNGMASWFGASVASAFFASLDRWSCVNVSTSDDLDDDNDDDASMFSNTASVNLSNRIPVASPSPAEKNDVANLPV